MDLDGVDVHQRERHDDDRRGERDLGPGLLAGGRDAERGDRRAREPHGRRAGPDDPHALAGQLDVGTSLRSAETISFVDAGITLPDVSPRSFGLDGGRWQIPGADDAELLVDRLVRHGVLVRDPVVAAVLRSDRTELSPRTVERRFRASTGLTRGAVVQIERARTAATMLAAGSTVRSVVEQLGYYDEPHLARMLRRYVGRSARQLRTGVGGAIALDPAQCTTS